MGAFAVVAKRSYTRGSFWTELKLGLVQWLALSLIWYFAQAGSKFDKDVLLESCAGSLGLSILWYAFRYSTGSIVEKIIDGFTDKFFRTRIEISEERILVGIKAAEPLYAHYIELLEALPKKAYALSAGENYRLDPYETYSSILGCARHCRESVISVDCDLGAWYYLCEPDDFKEIVGEEAQEQISSFLRERARRARTDFTYKLASILLRRLDPEERGHSLPGTSPVSKRVLIVRHEEHSLPAKVKIILRRMAELQRFTKRRMTNKVIFVPSLDALSNELRYVLDALQDIVIFDGEVAFKEYLLDPDDNRAEQSEVLTHKPAIANYMTLFNRLYEDNAQDIFDIEL